MPTEGNADHRDHDTDHGTDHDGQRFLAAYLPYLLRRADQTLSAPFYAALTRYGVARSEWRVLAVLADLDRPTVAQLTAAALSPQPTVTHALRRLEERGLVSRTSGEHDRRQRFVTITPAGRQLAETLIAEAEHLAAAQLVDAGDLSDLIRRLEDLTAHVESVSIRPDDVPRAG